MTTTIDASQAGMLQREVIIVTHTLVQEVGRLEAELHSHHEYVQELESRGLLFLAGPVLDDNGHPTGSSIWVLTVTGQAEAEAVAHADPYVKTGIRTVSFERWRINMGAINVRLRCSDRSFRLDGQAG